ncbi:MAG TPA: hypothetical protein DCG49_01430 [Ruminococcus sp.]|nr:hypothetical protein [Ruminococcus sp.]
MLEVDHMNEAKRAARQHKPKPAAYLTRDAVEQTVKACGIDRSRFSEVSKLQYQEIQKRFYYAFCNYRYHTEPRYTETEFRADLQEKVIAGALQQPDWDTFIQEIRNVLPDSEKLYLLANSKWVYAGYADEICRILSQTVDIMHWSDFAIFSMSFSYCIAYDDIEECAVQYQKKGV